MKCNICGHEGRSGSANCSRCGAPLLQAAPNAVDDRTVLRAVVTPAAIPPGPAQAPTASADDPWGLEQSAPAVLAPVQPPQPPSQQLVPAPQWVGQPQPGYLAPPVQHNVVVVTNRKSVGVALLLTFFFGPLGMFYSTVPGALIMLLVSIGLYFLSGGLSAFVTLPICMIWGGIAAKTTNDKMMSQVRNW